MRFVLATLALVAGVRKDVLNSQKQSAGGAATQGALMCATAIFSSCTAGYALSQAFWGSPGNLYVAILGGATWGFCVFCLDRAMIMSMDKFAHPLKCVLQLLIRIPFAIAISLIMSKPLVLRLAHNEILATLRAEARASITEEVQQNQDRLGYPDLRRTVDGLREEEADTRRRLSEEPASSRYRAAVASETQARVNRDRVRPVELNRIAALEARLRSAEQQLDSTEVPKSLQLQIAAARSTIHEADTRFAAASAEVSAAANDWRASQQELLSNVQKRRAHESQAMNVVRAKLDNENDRSKLEIESMNKPDLVRQYRALRRITSARDNSNGRAISSFELALDLLFLLLELTPLVVKAMARPTPLDEAQRAMEYAEVEEITLKGNQRANAREALAQVAVQVLDLALNKYKEATIEKIEDENMDLVQVRKYVGEVSSLLEVLSNKKANEPDKEEEVAQSAASTEAPGIEPTATDCIDRVTNALSGDDPQESLGQEEPPSDIPTAA